MHTFLARQPILDSRQNLKAYELLFRSGLENQFDAADGDQATSRVIAGSFLVFGLDEMLGPARAFINFTRKLLVEDYAAVLPSKRVVIEILEDVRPDEEVIKACRRLKDRGFTLALDDFVFLPEYQPLLEVADIVKVDFLASQPEERAALARMFLPAGITMLAEKVETKKQFREALDLGYQLFQGYFFCKPEIVSRRDVPSVKFTYLNLLRELNQPDVELPHLAEVVSRDMGVSYKVLRYINSAAFMVRNEVSTIRQALNLLGLNEMRKWASLMALAGMGGDQPVELLAASAVRAKAAETAAALAHPPLPGNEAFLTGLFSMLDTVFGRPLAEILDEITLGREVKDALLGRENGFRHLLELVIAMDRGDWPGVSRLAPRLGIDEALLPEVYTKAVVWQVELWSLI
jgi:c-di-GMP-related signal transduction protein